MQCRRLTELKELPKSIHDINDRTDQEMMLEAEIRGSVMSHLVAHDAHETWLQHLASWAQIPEAAD